MTETFYFNKDYHYLGENSPRRNSLPREQDAIFKLMVYKNPYEYEEYASLEREWKKVGVQIRQSNFKMCQGSIERTFFQGEATDETSVIFLLYFLARTRTEIHPELIGFALTDDLNGDEDDDETLYINALCANPKVRYLPTGGIKGVGSMLMRQIEWYARDSGEYSMIKLSALPYVINYYRKLGFRHVKDCDYLEDDAEETYSENDAEIKRLAKSNMRNRFKSDSLIDKAMRIELAKEKQMQGKGKYDEKMKKDYYMSNLNKYFEPYLIKFRLEDGEIKAYDDDNKKDNEINELLYQDNSAILELLNVLRGKGFSVACQEPRGKNVRHATSLDSDGDIMFPCDEDGYTMKKCLDVFDLHGEHDRPMRERHDLVNAEGGRKRPKKRRRRTRRQRPKRRTRRRTRIKPKQRTRQRTRPRPRKTKRRKK